MKEKFRVYLSGFKLRKIMEDNYYGIFFVWLILLFNKYTEGSKTIIASLVLMIPSMFVITSIYYHKISYDKVFYLLPMTLEERRKTIVSNYFFNVKIHLLVGLISLAMEIVLFKINILAAIYLIINIIILSFMIMPKGYNSYITQRFSIVMTACVLTYYFESFMLFEMNLYGQIFMYIVMAVIIIPLAFSCRKKIIEEFDYAMTYKEIKKAK